MKVIDYHNLRKNFIIELLFYEFLALLILFTRFIFLVSNILSKNFSDFLFELDELVLFNVKGFNINFFSILYFSIIVLSFYFLIGILY